MASITSENVEQTIREQAKALCTQLNDTIEKRERARSDKAKAQYEGEIDTMMRWFGAQDIQLEAKSYGSGYRLVPSDAEKEASRKESLAWDARAHLDGAERAKQEFIARLKSEQEHMARMLAHAEAGEWQYIGCFEFNGSNYQDLQRLNAEISVRDDMAKYVRECAAPAEEQLRIAAASRAEWVAAHPDQK